MEGLCLRKVSTSPNWRMKEWQRALLQYSSGAPVATERPPLASEPAGTFSPPTAPKRQTPEVPQPWFCPASFAGVCPLPSGLASWPWPSFSCTGLSSPPLFFFWTMIKGEPFRRYLLGICSLPYSFPTAGWGWGQGGMGYDMDRSFRFPGISHW